MSATPQSDKQVLMKMEVKFGGGVEQVVVHEGDDPSTLATEFVQRHGLKPSSISVIANSIQGHINEYHRKAATASTPSTPSTVSSPRGTAPTTSVSTATVRSSPAVAKLAPVKPVPVKAIPAKSAAVSPSAAAESKNSATANTSSASDGIDASASEDVLPGHMQPVIIVECDNDKANEEEITYEFRRKGFLVGAHLHTKSGFGFILSLSPKLVLKLALESNLPLLPVDQYSSEQRLALVSDAIEVIQRGSTSKHIDSVWVAHNPEVLAKLDKATGETKLGLIKSYYGSKIAMYFGWLDYYTELLVVPSIFGTILFMYQLYTGEIDSPWVPFFCVLISLWSTYFLEFWKRRSNVLSFNWNVFGVEESDAQNDLAQATVKEDSGVTMRMFLSYFAVMSFVYFMIRIMLYYKYLQLNANEVYGADSWSKQIPTVLYSILPAAFSAMFETVTDKLNKFENHATRTDAENSLIFKVFALEFCNRYCALFYTAFWLRDLALLRSLLISLLTINAMLNNFVELGMPMLKSVLNRYLLRMKQKKAKASAEKQVAALIKAGKQPPAALVKAANASIATTSELTVIGNSNNSPQDDNSEEQNTNDRAKQFLENALAKPDYDLNADYLEIVIQYGYVTMFVVAFPLAPALAWLNNLFEGKVDLFKLTECRRPALQQRSNIGSWQSCMEFVSFLAVITNCFLIVMVSSRFEMIIPAELEVHMRTESGRLVAMIIMEHALLAFKILMMYLIDDVPRWIQEIIAQRQTREREESRMARLKTYAQEEQRSNGPASAKDRRRGGSLSRGLSRAFTFNQPSSENLSEISGDNPKASQQQVVVGEGGCLPKSGSNGNNRGRSNTSDDATSGSGGGHGRPSMMMRSTSDAEGGGLGGFPSMYVGKDGSMDAGDAANGGGNASTPRNNSPSMMPEWSRHEEMWDDARTAADAHGATYVDTWAGSSKSRDPPVDRLVQEHQQQTFGFDPAHMIVLIVLPIALQYFQITPWLYVPLAVLFFGYLQSKKDRIDRKIAMGIVSDPTLLKLILQEMPKWTTDSEFQQMEWANYMLQKFWPMLAIVGEEKALRIGNGILERNKPSFLSELKIKKFNFGTIAPRFLGIRMHQTGVEEGIIRCDLDFRYAGDPQIIIQVGPTEVEIVNLRVSTMLRCECLEFTPRMTPFKLGSATMMKKPFVDFNIKVAGLDIMSTKSLTNLVHTLFHKALASVAMFPRKIFVPMGNETHDAETIEALKVLNPVGIIYLKLEKGVDLIQANIFGSDPYVEIETIDQFIKSECIYSTTNPVWEESFDIVVYDRGSQVISFSVFDYDLRGNNKSLGTAQFEVNKLPFHRKKHITLQLKGVETGSIVLSCLYLPLNSSHDLKKKASDAKPVLPRSVFKGMNAGLGLDGNEGADADGNVPGDVLFDLPMEELQSDDVLVKGDLALEHVDMDSDKYHIHSAGLAILTISNIKLRCIKPGSVSNWKPAVSFHVGTKTMKTHSQKNVVNPEFEERFVFVIKNTATTERILVKALDKKKKLMTGNRQIGEVTVSLYDLVNMNAQGAHAMIEKEYKLESEDVDCMVSFKMQWSTTA